MQPADKFSSVTAAVYVIISFFLFQYFKAGAYEHASANALFYGLFLELSHLKDVTGSLLLYLILTGSLLFFILYNIKNRTIRYIIVGMVLVLSMPLLSMWGL